jgi:hypothetical protein
LAPEFHFDLRLAGGERKDFSRLDASHGVVAGRQPHFRRHIAGLSAFMEGDN